MTTVAMGDIASSTAASGPPPPVLSTRWKAALAPATPALAILLEKLL
jgi:hypothetical protein